MFKIHTKPKLMAVVVSIIFFFQSARGDFQWWSTAEFSADLTKKWRATFEEELRFGEGSDNLYYEHSDIGMVWSGMADWIDWGFNFRLIEQKDSEGTCRPEYRPHMNLTFKNLLGQELSNRSRIEYRDIDSTEYEWRYRNKTTYKLPFTLTEWKLKPYVADEVFIECDSSNMDRNRFYAGLGFDITKSIKGEVYYLLQSSRDDGQWNNINVLGTKIKFDF